MPLPVPPWPEKARSCFASWDHSLLPPPPERNTSTPRFGPVGSPIDRMNLVSFPVSGQAAKNPLQSSPGRQNAVLAGPGETVPRG